MDAMIGSSINLLAGQPFALQALVIILGTFVLEDAATVLAAMHAQEGGIPIPVALVSLYAGIVLGDLGLYGLGRLASRVGWIARLVGPPQRQAAQAWVSDRVFRVVLVSRFLPGARLPTYTACGFLGVDLIPFTLAAIVATLAWTSLLFGLSLRIGQFLIDHLGAWRWAGAVGIALTLTLLGRVAARMQHASR
jgi:membrane protein DedA with SNARE-associated domain